MSDSAPKNPAALEYAGPGVEKPKKSLYPVVIVLGVLPLVVGLSIASMYSVTRWSGLEMVGLLTILGGTVCVLVGAGCLYIYWRHERHAGRYPRDMLFLRVFFGSMLLLANFPAAVVCMGWASDVRTRLNITVINRGSTKVNSCVLVTNTERKELGPIAPGQTVTYSMPNPGGGALNLVRSSSSGTSTTSIIEYVDEDVYGNWTIVLDGDTTRIGR